MKKVLLIVLDGWGHTDVWDPPNPGNAIANANVPTFRRLLSAHPASRLKCSGLDVGIPEGQMGNSEVGHSHLGGGRTIKQDLVRINEAMSDLTLSSHLRLDEIAEHLEASGGALHLLGLVSDGGVHSHIDHLLEILKAIPEQLPVFLHAITDGRDTSPTSGRGFVGEVAKALESLPKGTIATVCGRYYAMDRDMRWERTHRAFDLYALGRGESFESADSFISMHYSEGTTDEFLPPGISEEFLGRGITSDDAILFFDFRADRMRQMSSALVSADFSGFDREGWNPPTYSISMTEYQPEPRLEVAFEAEELRNTLGQVLEFHGIGQLRTSETEKYAHVTYFFNCGREEPFQGEHRVLCPSPKVPTYDLQPEMNAEAVGEAIIVGMKSTDYRFILGNFANPDMVGHTGLIPATVKAVEAVDAQLTRILEVATAEGWTVLVTADHGNAEKMRDEEGEPHTAHTLEPVDCILVDRSLGDTAGLRDGSLADLAPTILYLMGLEQPEEMTGKNLVEEIE